MTESLVRALLKDRPIAYKPILARALGGVTVGLWVSQLIYWSDKGRDPDGWIYKTYIEWEAETAMSRGELDGARKRAGMLGIVEEKLAQVPARLHYRINWERLEELLAAQVEQSSSQETCNPVCIKHAIKVAQNIDTITESTTESTTDIIAEEKEKTTEPTWSDVVTTYQDNIGMISGAVCKDRLIAMVDEANGVRGHSGAYWVVKAIKEASKSARRGVNLNYLDKVFKTVVSGEAKPTYEKGDTCTGKGLARLEAKLSHS